MTIDEYVTQAKKDGTPIIDVRPAEMYKEGHIPGAINIPLNHIETADVKNGSDLYCVTGYHAGIAHEELAKRGIETTVIGGIENYTGEVARG